jgi:serine/threonine protein kinase
MGAVYLASDGSDQVALKLIHPELATDPHFRARFRREVELTARVRGPHVAELVGADPDGRTPWLAARFVEGPTLAQRVATEGAAGPDAVTAVALALASALADIHAAGVVHRATSSRRT